ncbi:MAG: hypothetical protein DRH21_01170 [Deltaproteobacteria bacterium]|nr:MAG: hypothetical protein DRH21_01170 [Deltaproteobacteria bacterium]
MYNFTTKLIKSSGGFIEKTCRPIVSEKICQVIRFIVLITLKDISLQQLPPPEAPRRYQVQDGM